MNKSRFFKLIFFTFLIFLIGDCWRILIPFGNNYCNYCLFKSDEKQGAAMRTSGFLSSLTLYLVRDCGVIPSNAASAINLGKEIFSKEDKNSCTINVRRIFNAIDIHRIKVADIDPWGNPYLLNLRKAKIEVYTESGGDWHGQSQIISSSSLSFKSSDNKKIYIDTLKRRSRIK